MERLERLGIFIGDEAVVGVIVGLASVTLERGGAGSMGPLGVSMLFCGLGTTSSKTKRRRSESAFVLDCVPPVGVCGGRLAAVCFLADGSELPNGVLMVGVCGIVAGRTGEVAGGFGCVLCTILMLGGSFWN